MSQGIDVVARLVAGEVLDSIQCLSAKRHPAVLRVEQVITAIPGAGSPSFPSNWCLFAACVLARQLSREIPDATVEVVEGRVDGSLDKHFWVSIEGVLVDITSDQFLDGPESPLVTRDSGWHDRRFPKRICSPVQRRPLHTAEAEAAIAVITVAVEEEMSSTPGLLARRHAEFRQRGRCEPESS